MRGLFSWKYEQKVSENGVLKEEWSLNRMVFHQSGLSSWWSINRVVRIRVVSYQGGLLSGVPLYLVQLTVER